MITKIKTALSTEYVGLGLSEKTIGRLAEYVKGFVENEEDIATAVKRDDVKILATSIQGEIAGIKRAKEAAEAALADYKAKHPDSQDTVDPEDPKDPKDLKDPKGLTLDDVKATFAELLKPVTDSINEIKTQRTVSEALTTAKAGFFGNKWTEKFKDEADDAWERATELFEAQGSKMNADELVAKAKGYFDKAVGRKGVDSTKPFEPDKDPADLETDFSSTVQMLQDEGVIPKDK